jgi:hypothetical protein
VRPYDIDEFAVVEATRETENGAEPITNFSYMQAWHVSGRGFVCFFTRYNFPADRTSCFMTSTDGVRWSRWQRLAAIDHGHYQVSGVGKGVAGSMMNYHPQGKGLNWRTNLYYLETPDFGETWRSVDGTPLTLPLTTVETPALVRDYATEGLNVYLKDIRYDSEDRPVLLYVTSQGYASGPENDPRTWTIAHWTGDRWIFHPVTTSDNNYDFGELSLDSDTHWRITAPFAVGPQPYNPGGEISAWETFDAGATWREGQRLTASSERNHTYVRRPLHAHPDFDALWADGHGRQPSQSSLYIARRDGTVYRLPRRMTADHAPLDLVLATTADPTAEARAIDTVSGKEK